MTPWQQAGPPWQGQRVEAKNPAVAVIASFFLPGLGTMLNGEATKGVIMLVAWVASWFAFLLLAWILIGFLFLPVAFGVWIWGMVDAHQGARAWNARHGIIS